MLQPCQMYHFLKFWSGKGSFLALFPISFYTCEIFSCVIFSASCKIAKSQPVFGCQYNSSSRSQKFFCTLQQFSVWMNSRHQSLSIFKRTNQKDPVIFFSKMGCDLSVCTDIYLNPVPVLIPQSIDSAICQTFFHTGYTSSFFCQNSCQSSCL